MNANSNIVSNITKVTSAMSVDVCEAILALQSHERAQLHVVQLVYQRVVKHSSISLVPLLAMMQPIREKSIC